MVLIVPLGNGGKTETGSFFKDENNILIYSVHGLRNHCISLCLQGKEQN
jgi:hypothetical protein